MTRHTSTTSFSAQANTEEGEQVLPQLLFVGNKKKKKKKTSAGSTYCQDLRCAVRLRGKPAWFACLCAESFIVCCAGWEELSVRDGWREGWWREWRAHRGHRAIGSSVVRT